MTIMVFAYGVTAIVSMLVAVLIKFMTTLLSGMQQRKAHTNVQPAERVAAVPAATDTAVIAAAVYAALGDTFRIARIEETGRGVLWVASGRFPHHRPHVLTDRPSYKTTPV